jgi:hypothetical protein
VLGSHARRMLAPSQMPLRARMAAVAAVVQFILAFTLA